MEQEIDDNNLEKPSLYLLMSNKDTRQEYDRLGKELREQDLETISRQGNVKSAVAFFGISLLSGVLAYVVQEPGIAFQGVLGGAGMSIIVKDFTTQWKENKLISHSPAFYYLKRQTNTLEETLFNL